MVEHSTLKLAKAIPIQLIRMEISLLLEEPSIWQGNPALTLMEQLPTTGGDIYINGENKRKLSTPCLEAVGLPEVADLKAVDLVGLVDAKPLLPRPLTEVHQSY